MKVFLAADHRGFALKNYLKSQLAAANYEIGDCGAETLDADDDYPDYGEKAAREVADNANNNRGILICGSGVGMAVVANKVPGVRASLIHEGEMVKAARQDDDLNVLALGANFITEEKAWEVVNIFLETDFIAGERHRRRLKKISQLENESHK